MTQDERTAMELSKQLPEITDNIEQLLWSADYAIDVEALDALCYNGLYGTDGKFDGHRYIKQLVMIDNAVVCRVYLASYYRDENPDGYKRDENNELVYDEDGELIDLFDDEDYVNNDLYFPDFKYGEVAQFWTLPNGNKVTLAVSRDQEWYMRDVNGCWTIGSPLMPANFDTCEDVLFDNYRCYDEACYWANDCEVTQKNILLISHVIKEFSKYDGGFEMTPHAEDEFAKCFKHWGYLAMYSNYMLFGMRSTAAQNFHTIKIAHRNGYRPTYMQQNRWINLLETIKFCNGNLEDPRNYMPKDIDETFAYWIERKNNKIKKLQREEGLKFKLALAEAERTQTGADDKYIASKAAYLVIRFGNDEYDFQVLQNVGQFRAIGDMHHQCMFTNGYFKHDNEVLVCCTEHDTGRYVGTSTVNIDNFYVHQPLGHRNQVPTDHEKIVQIIRENMQLFRDAKEAMQQCKEERDKWISERLEENRPMLAVV